MRERVRSIASLLVLIAAVLATVATTPPLDSLDSIAEGGSATPYSTGSSPGTCTCCTGPTLDGRTHRANR
jgi:hypothetical protein